MRRIKATSFVLESVYRRLLRESVEGSIEGLAALVFQQSGVGAAVLYRPSTLFAALKKDPEDVAAFHDAVLGYVSVQDSGHPCSDAWEVIRSAGPGYGKAIYGLAYAMSPSGVLMADRHQVSKSAYSAWSKLSAKGRRTVQLDDVDAKPEKQLTPEDPSDDCVLHKSNDEDCTGRDVDPLNKAYKAEGWERGMLNKLKQAHASALKALEGLEVGRDIEDEILSAGEMFFGLEYSRQAKTKG